MQTTARSLTFAWLALAGLTLTGALLGEAGQPGFWVTLSVAVMMAVKGRLVIDHFLELGRAHRSIRKLVRLYAHVIPAMVVITYLFGPQIARLTTL